MSHILQEKTCEIVSFRNVRQMLALFLLLRVLVRSPDHFGRQFSRHHRKLLLGLFTGSVVLGLDPVGASCCPDFIVI